MWGLYCLHYKEGVIAIVVKQVKEQWKEKRDTEYVNDLEISRRCELHWFEEDSAGCIKIKVTRFYY